MCDLCEEIIKKRINHFTELMTLIEILCYIPIDMDENEFHNREWS